MLKNIIFILFFIFLSSSINDTKSDDSMIYCEISGCSGSDNDMMSIKFLKEGILCRNSYKPYPNLFVDSKNLDRKLMNRFELFLHKDSAFARDSSYSCSNEVLDGCELTIVLRKENRIKVFKLYACYLPVFDSIFYYMNQLIPADKRNKYEIYPGRGCKCQ